MDKEQITKIKAMLASCNSADINLAGLIIKDQLLKITDEELEVFFELCDFAQNNKGKEVRTFSTYELLKGEVKDISLDSDDMIYEWKLKGPSNIRDIFSKADRFSDKPLIGITNAKGKTRKA